MAGISHSLSQAIFLEAESDTPVHHVHAILSAYKDSDYYAYERGDCWHIGLGRRASLSLDAAGESVTVFAGEQRVTQPVGQGFAEVARRFVDEHGEPGGKTFGYVGFNYALFTRGLCFEPGHWPLASLLVPRVEATIRNKSVEVSGGDSSNVERIRSAIRAAPPPAGHVGQEPQSLDSLAAQRKYTYAVSKALEAIEQGRIEKVIVSRDVPVRSRVDMLATLIRGRAASMPKRTFCLSHAGFQATGFSPELVVSCAAGRVLTEPLAGTRALTKSAAENRRLRLELENDPKEVREHIMSAKAAVEELASVCTPHSAVVEDLMSVRECGRVQHLGSSVAGSLSRSKDVWDVFNVVFPSITASGLPKDQALAIISEIEGTPRELYSGAVLVVEGADALEATLVLRTVFQDERHQWVQAGAGIIAQSQPRREFVETCEKLASIAPHVVELQPRGSA
ncbi:hypothetical protein HIM_07529 [Hirsutella minnesotensis 3608]|uniref:Chorismate-utilising enzyme C-terminal domain-containing protein n=1 Tax=Hirsutella minnesotensis 3608 TaxID=1043627 RepID=A0A0F7ZN52_9HYPO|nr:hypothetical protein HIM_07529 [Hirsutella minnesotensis 3608]